MDDDEWSKADFEVGKLFRFSVLKISIKATFKSKFWQFKFGLKNSWKKYTDLINFQKKSLKFNNQAIYPVTKW